MPLLCPRECYLNERIVIKLRFFTIIGSSYGLVDFFRKALYTCNTFSNHTENSLRGGPTGIIITGHEELVGIEKSVWKGIQGKNPVTSGTEE